MGIQMIIGLIAGALLGGGIGYLIRLIQSKIKIAELERDLLKAEKQTRLFGEQLRETTDELVKTKDALKSTINAMELLQAYKAIDEKTKRKIEDIEKTIKEGKPTKDTFEEYAKLIEDMNNKNKNYNTRSNKK